MLLISVRVAPSLIHGLGIFSIHRLPRGTPIWRFEPGFDTVFSRPEWSVLPLPAWSHLRAYGFLRLNDHSFIKSGDFACFMNHSDSPNTGASGGPIEPVITVALRDLEADEELTCDYWAFDADAAWKLGKVELESPVGASGLEDTARG